MTYHDEHLLHQTLKKSPKTPARGEKPKFSFKTRSKGKRLLSKTPRKTSSFQKSSSSAFKTPEKSSEELATELLFSGTVDESPWKSPSELARESIRKIRRKARLSQGQEKKEGLKKAPLKGATKGILKKLQPAPGWKPFGTPAKWKLDGHD